MTLVVEKGELVVARIIHGGMIDRQGILHQFLCYKETVSVFQTDDTLMALVKQF